jgi:hypothetical protein
MASEMTGARKIHWSPTRLMLLQPDIKLLRKRVNLLKQAKTKTGWSSPVLSYGSPGRNDENNALVLFNSLPGDWSEYFRVSTSFFASTRRMVLFLICLVGIPCASLAQTNQTSWAHLSRLQTGRKIEIVDMASKKHLGTFVNVSDSSISYRDRAGEQSILKQNVRSVKLAENKKRLRNALIGAGVGAVAGAGITAASWENNGFLGSKGTGAAVGAVLGGVSGAIVGALLPDHKTVYRAVSR